MKLKFLLRLIGPLIFVIIFYFYVDLSELNNILVAIQWPFPVAERDPPRKYLVEQITAQRRQQDTSTRAFQPGAVELRERLLDIALRASKALWTEIIGHSPGHHGLYLLAGRFLQAPDLPQRHAKKI